MLSSPARSTSPASSACGESRSQSPNKNNISSNADDGDETETELDQHQQKHIATSNSLSDQFGSNINPVSKRRKQQNPRKQMEADQAEGE